MAHLLVIGASWCPACASLKTKIESWRPSDYGVSYEYKECSVDDSCPPAVPEVWLDGVKVTQADLFAWMASFEEEKDALEPASYAEPKSVDVRKYWIIFAAAAGVGYFAYSFFDMKH